MKEIREVMTASEAAEYLQVHIKTLYDWIRAGELRVIKLGPRSMRILKEDLLQFLETKATTEPGVVQGADIGSSEREESARIEEAADASRFRETEGMKDKKGKLRSK